VHAKWVFVGLAAVFALGFVFFGVGSGSTGISDALQSAFHFGSSGGSSISSLQKKVAKHPNDPTAWHNLASAYEQKQKTAEAVVALQRVVALRPKDQDALSELAAEQTQLANSYGTQLQTLSAANATVAASAAFQPAPTSALGKIYGQNPIANAVQQSAQTAVSDLQQKVLNADGDAERSYKQLAKLNPNDATTQLSLGQAAQTANDIPTAVVAYSKFLKLAPDDPLAPQVRKLLKALRTPTTGSSPAPSR
jgi:cytochrome c-type biogenesis protein CcmH/NrfG